MTVTIYLAGALRDGVRADAAWREELFCALEQYALAGLVRVFSPCLLSEMASTLDRKAADRYMCDVEVWAVQQADILVANFLPLAEGYPSTGTFVEWGLSLAQRTLRLAIWPEQMELHPFIEQSLTLRFHTLSAVTKFLVRAIPLWDGLVPVGSSRQQADLFENVPPEECAQS